MKTAKLRRGIVARYTGTDHAFMTGLKVKLIAPIIGDDDRPTGFWDVAPWIEKDQRFSWVTSDARREDLVPLTEETGQ
ncbi:MAG: hypothetical protein KJZ87_16260 [Thermoguttaceae bacterium]|nr:hypothetical protein [Thermoguttaceae bacterium]